MTALRFASMLSAALLLSAIAAPPHAAVADPATKKPSDKKKKEPAKQEPKESSGETKKAALGFKVGPREASHFEIDPSAEGNNVSFTSKTPKETFVGKTTQIVGKLEADPHKLKNAKGEFSVAWNTLDTGKPMRNEHMMSAPWVEAMSFPQIVFTLDGMEKMSHLDKRGTKLKATLIGAFSINGAEKKLRIPATLEYVQPPKAKPKKNGADDPGDDGDVREGIRIEAKFALALKDFNIVGRGVGDKVAAKQQIQVSLFLPLIEKEPEPAQDPQPVGPTPRRPRRPSA